MQGIYSIFISLFSWGVKLHSLFSSKSKKMVLGQRETIKFLKSPPKDEFIWFHAASLGEFEQGRPVIEALKKNNPNLRVLLTFFSPSGYEVRKNYKFADKVLYLPLDTYKNAKLFIEGLNIKQAIFIKYEFWFNFLSFLQAREIPTIYISTVFRENQMYFRNNWMLQILKKVNHFYLQNESSGRVAKKNGLKNITVAGDSRLDSVLLNVKEEFNCKEIEEGLDGREVIVFGSTWSGDHSLIVPFIEKYGTKFQYIIAPHEIKPDQINSLKRAIKLPASFLSKKETLQDVLIIDSIGKLKYLYRYASLAYVGGGFNNNIHNTLEPLAYNIPVVFGPAGYTKFQEAIDIVNNEMGRLTSEKEFENDILFYLKSATNRDLVINEIESYISENEGATQKILSGLNVRD